MEKFRFRLVRICFILTLFYYFPANTIFSQSVTITVNATQNKRLISPSIYGRNESFDHTIQFYKDAGLLFARMNGGNNASGYNWSKKITVHPDWYNNVYGTDWDAMAKNINTNYSNMQGMFAFQLLGRVASNQNNNFNDWAYNQSQYWSGVSQNLAGGGTPDPNGGSKALVEGNIDLFSKLWPADSSVAILNHWFGANGLGLNKNQFQYWNMDNEVDVWNGTHDWAMPTLLSASAFMDRYIDLAKKAKALYPGIKLCGPVTTSEWQWYKWSNESIWINGRYYPWIEYFIKRLGDEYKATGIKLVDVIDIHNYPYYNNDAEALQGHRIYYDTNYDYPGSNGIKTSTGGWDATLTKQYIFKRFNDWLNEHFGANNGITVGLSEWSPGPSESNLASVIYASHLGTFANNGVELFSPWIWFNGMWETLHLFSRNAKKYSVSSTSSLENTVSAYTSINESADSMTVIIVNRDQNSVQNVIVNLNGFSIDNGNYKTLQLSSLPATETFISHTQNALKTNQVSASSNSLTISVPKLSTTAIILTKSTVMPPQTTYVTLTNRATGLLIDGMGRTNNGDNCGQWSNSGSPAQQWVIETVGSYVKIKNRNTGLYLDGMGRTTNNSIAGQYSSSTSNNQQWQKVASGNYYKFKNRSSGLYLDGLGKTINGADLGQYKSSNSNNQLWTVTTVANTLKALSINNSEEKETHISIYPNPFSNTFNFTINNTEKVTRIEILDMTGKLYEVIDHSSIKNQIELGTSLRPNMYIVKVYGENITKVFKVIKK
jgi:hypothetical protein